MRIDAHQHFWDLQRFRYGWMPAGSPIARNFLPEDLQPILEQNRFDGCITVQANSLIEETWWLLELARTHKFIKGVVGWVDLQDPHLGATLDQLQKEPKFRGVRHLVHDEEDTHWILRPPVLSGLRELAARGIPYDLLLRPVHLPLVPLVAEQVPRLRMVIDHLAKPRIKDHAFDSWREDLAAAARIPNVYCKLSGMITEADPLHWSSADLRPYVEHAMQLFGPERLMFGSDWPVCTQAGTWKQVLAALTQAMGAQVVGVREKILGLTAIEFYRLNV